MRSLANCVTFFLAALLIVFTAAPAFGAPTVNVEPAGKLEFSTDVEIPSTLWSFCITETGLVIIPDQEKGNIKIYEKSGNRLALAKIPDGGEFGKKDLSAPAFCFYNKNEGKFGVLDFGKKEVIVYDRIGKKDFVRAYTAPCPGKGFDVQLSGNKLVISGYITSDENVPNELYYFNLEDLPRESQPYEFSTIPPTFLLNSEYKYNSTNTNNTDIFTIGTKGWFDIQGDNIYYAWEGDLRIIEINIKTGEKSTFDDGRRERPHYIRPYISEDMRTARKNRDFNVLQKEKGRMSFVRNIFATSKYVLAIVEGPVRGKDNPYWMEFYTLDGKFIKETPFPGQASWMMYFDKDEEVLYSLIDREKNSRPFIVKYKIF